MFVLSLDFHMDIQVQCFAVLLGESMSVTVGFMIVGPYSVFPRVGENFIVL